MFPSSSDSPVAVINAIMAYTEADGSLCDIASALHLDRHGFTKLIQWYLTQLPEPPPGERITTQCLVWIILFQLADVERKKLARLTDKVERLERKLKRLNTPYPDRTAAP